MYISKNIYKHNKKMSVRRLNTQVHTRTKNDLNIGLH